MKIRTPSYRHHKPSGQAVVTLNGRDHYLGKFGSPESRAEYDRLLAEWLAAGRNRPAPPEPAPPDPVTVNELIAAFWRHARSHYRTPEGEDSEELGNIKAALRPLRRLYGPTPARDFGPLSFRAVREAMVGSGLARTSVNARVGRIRRAFRWAASVELVPVAVVQALETVAGLQKGRTPAREPEPVGPVELGRVEKTLPFLSAPVAAMVRLQLLTGMRPGEACAMRGRDLVAGDAASIYRPGSHKSAWRGRSREIVFGPRAMEVIRGFIGPDPAAYLFDPRQAVAEHHARRGAARKSKPTPSERSRRRASPGAGHAGRYTRSSYRNAILRACDRAFPHPTLSGIRARDLTEDQRTELVAWRKEHRWHPNQLRHTVATEVRARIGLEACQAVLGHARADVTQIYAQRDLAKAVEVMREIG